MWDQLIKKSIFSGYLSSLTNCNCCCSYYYKNYFWLLYSNVQMLPSSLETHTVLRGQLAEEEGRQALLYAMLICHDVFLLTCRIYYRGGVVIIFLFLGISVTILLVNILKQFLFVCFNRCDPNIPRPLRRCSYRKCTGKSYEVAQWF